MIFVDVSSSFNKVYSIYRKVLSLFLPNRVLNIRSKKHIKGRYALVSYIVEPYWTSRKEPRFYQHTNIFHCKEIVRVLLDLGYRVDLIHYQDTNFKVRKPYQIFIGHGGVNFEKIACQLSENCIKVYFSTGSYWRFHNHQEEERVLELNRRRKVYYSFDRYIIHSEESALELSDYIIGVGNEHTLKTYEKFKNVIMINNTVLGNNRMINCSSQKNFNKGKNNFLYLAGWGNVHKGLDLLLEAFSQMPDNHLWVCTKLEDKFIEIYRNELKNYTNIHAIGWLQPRSRKFYQILDLCNFVILPSCSEGVAQSVLECMSQGLVPIVSLASGVNVNGLGFTIEPCTVENISSTVKRAALCTEDQLIEMSLESQRYVRTHCSEDKFTENLTNAFNRISEGYRQIIRLP